MGDPHDFVRTPALADLGVANQPALNASSGASKCQRALGAEPMQVVDSCGSSTFAGVKDGSWITRHPEVELIIEQVACQKPTS
jgi:hypothetical protein